MNGDSQVVENKWKSSVLVYLLTLLYAPVWLSMILIVGVSYFILAISPLYIDRYMGLIGTIQRHQKLSYAVFLLLGLGLYFLRKRFLLAYAILEIIGGLTLGWNALRNTYPQALVFWAAFMGAAYLLVRGFDNFRLGSGVKKWDQMGKSTCSLPDALSDAVGRIIREDVASYYRNDDKEDFRETHRLDIVATKIRMFPRVHYEVKVRAKRRAKRRDRESDEKYAKLSKSVRGVLLVRGS